MKVRVTIISKQVAVFDAGDFPVGLIRDILTKNDGTFDGNWSLGDIAKSNSETFTTESVEVEEVK